jgi:Tol biopolymer transport system component
MNPGNYRVPIALLSCLLLLGCVGGTVSIEKVAYMGVTEGWLSRFFGYSTKIEVINTDGSGHVNAVLPRALGFEPEWSPDGKWVVFSTEDVNRPYSDPVLHIMRSDGSHNVQVTNHGCVVPTKERGISTSCDTGATAPSWSPDGTHIAFQSNNRTIYILDVSCLIRGEKCTFTPRLLTDGQSPDWSPDGKRLVYEIYDGKVSQVYRIYIINADGNETPIDITPDGKSCHDPVWSPSDDKIAMDCTSSSQECGDIYVMNVDGANVTRLTNGGERAMNISPTWSPDGSKLAFISNRDGLNKCTGNQCCSDIRNKDSLFLMDSDGSNTIRLSTKDDEIVRWGWYAWIP